MSCASAAVADHDPLCTSYWCNCDLIAKVRAAVAEEIAQAIEAFSGDFIADECAAIARTFKGVSE